MEYHSTYGDERDQWTGNHFNNTDNREKVIDIIYDYLDVLDSVTMENDKE